jgi:uncharacterized protein (DUF58 family)
MQLHPTRTAVDLTVAAIFVTAVGLVAERAAIVAWGGALLLGLMIARAVTLLGVARVRSAGFEMLWQEQRRLARVGVGEPLELRAEVRNRDDRAARYVGLRSLHSPHLDVELEPRSGEVPAGGRLSVSVKVTGRRVGRHGLYGLSLEVQGGPGLYEVPLTFANPFGVEVLPRTYATRTRSAIGGRSRSHAEAGRPGMQPRGGYDLREIREYRAGDPFKRLAWKASARRGQLMVREFDLEERDVVWMVLDASVELWAGDSGKAPLDIAIESAAAIAERHLEQGNRVGLAIVGARRLAWLPPASGAAHAARLMTALSFETGCHDADRSGLDEAEVGLRVLEHLRPLEPQLVDNVRPGDLERLSRRANLVVPRCPFKLETPQASSPREGILRRYMTGFGIETPARLEPDRARTDATLVAALKEIARLKPRASVITIASPLPDPTVQSQLLEGLARLPQRHCRIRWIPTPLDAGISSPAISDAVRFAVQLRSATLSRTGALALRRAGIRIEAVPRRPRRLGLSGTRQPDPDQEPSEDPNPEQPSTQESQGSAA